VPVAAVAGTEERVPAIAEIPVIAIPRQAVRASEGGDVAYPLLSNEIRHESDHHDEDEEEDEENHSARVR